MKFTNENGISLPIAVWLLFDDYDYVNEPNYISATSLLAPLKQYVLAKRIPNEEKVHDVMDFMASSLGSAIHAGIEKAWTVAGPQLMAKLGYPKHVCDRIAVNPTDEYLKNHPDAFPVWIEIRTTKELNGFLIGGKFDMVMDGHLFDNKSTSVWTYILGNNAQAYTEQGSIYRWLNPDKILDDHVYINYIFTDWQKAMAKQRPDTYPQHRTLEANYPLMPIDKTEEFIKNKLDQIRKFMGSKEEDMPRCSDEELWRSEPVFKYYSDPEKMTRATKNFDNLAEANKMKSEKGKGIVVTVPGTVKRCQYCPAAPICQQRLEYITEED